MPNENLFEEGGSQGGEEIGALWVNDPTDADSPILTGVINNQRVSVYKNRRWSEEDKRRLPIYHVKIRRNEISQDNICQGCGEPILKNQARCENRHATCM